MITIIAGLIIIFLLAISYKRMKTTFKIMIIIALLATGFIGYSFYRNFSFNEGFKRIIMGDSQGQVIMQMGKPDKEIFAGDKGFWSSHIKGSVKEYHYEAKIIPEIWIIGFDSKGSVVYRSHNIM